MNLNKKTFDIITVNKDNWLQQEKNIRYIVNIVFLVLGVIIGIMNIKCK